MSYMQITYEQQQVLDLTVERKLSAFHLYNTLLYSLSWLCFYQCIYIFSILFLNLLIYSSSFSDDFSYYRTKKFVPQVGSQK